ncbi:MAG: hypothetical protein M3321_04370 [Actinomycetota bacterium]|nr:hypothetical protein [Actinomycetota bacterium]
MLTWFLLWFAVSLVVGLVVRRWPVVVVPAAASAIFYAGLHADWWLYGVGDRWHVPTAISIVGGTLGAVAGVVLGRRRTASREAAGSTSLHRAVLLAISTSTSVLGYCPERPVQSNQTTRRD